MIWSILIVAVLATGIGALLSAARHGELRRMRRTLAEQTELERVAGPGSRLQHPVVDLSRCLGCGTCIAACPEDGVLDLVHGQAAVVHGAGCVGVSACERSCPVGAITVTLAEQDSRRDIPVLTEGLEAEGMPGLFLAGEVTARSLIKTAVDHGRLVAEEVGRRCRQQDEHADPEVLDLLVVGAGPAGLACTLAAQQQGLRVLAVEQEPEIGGTVARYPRHKLVMTMPVEMPGHGRLKRATYAKEELMELWQRIAREHSLPVRTGVTFLGLERDPNGGWFLVRTDEGVVRARHVCMALGRRGTPNRLGIPGEDLPKVAFSLSDAAEYAGRRVLVVGGGDSAVEAALAIATQPDTEVRLSYRRERFFRLRPRNAQKLKEAVAAGRVQLHLTTQLLAIRPGDVDLLTNGAGSADGATTAGRTAVGNDHVLLMLGGTPPFKLLEQSGVSFDPARRKAAPLPTAQGMGLLPALLVGFVLAVAALGFAVWHADYYGLPTAEQPTHPKHGYLRPGRAVGLWLGITATALVLLNLTYLLRKARSVRWVRFGSLQGWMTLHIATGTLALLTAYLHSALAPGNTPGGHAFWALVVLFLSGAIGRYFYAQVPRAANGRELELAEIRGQLDRLMEPWDGAGRRFREKVRDRLGAELDRQQWQGSFTGRLVALLGMGRRLRRLRRWIREQGGQDGVDTAELHEVDHLARRAWSAALMVGHFEDLRALLVTWRFVHRWVAVLLVALVGIHIVHALAYGSLLSGPPPMAPVFPIPTGGG